MNKVESISQTDSQRQTRFSCLPPLDRINNDISRFPKIDDLYPFPNILDWNSSLSNMRKKSQRER